MEERDYRNLQFEEVKELIARFSSFSLGRDNLMNLQPEHNRLMLQRRLDRLKEALALTVSYGPMPFSGIHDIKEEVDLAMKDGTLNAGELLRIADQAYGIEKIKDYFAGCQLPKENLEDLIAALYVCKETSREINRCIGGDGNVNDNASSHLAAIRRQLKNLQASISRKMGEFINKNSRYLQENITATRNDRTVVLVKNTYKNTVEGLQYGSSASGMAVYVEPAELVGMNNELQQTKSEETEEIKRILFALSQKVKQDGARLLANTETLGLLDCLFAMGQWAARNDGTVGEIAQSDLVIRKARHPLIDSARVVANSYTMIKPVRTILITGPNTGGKTVSLKIIGLFSLMLSCGMPLLCESASIPLFEEIYTDIGDSQSITDELSTFSGHIKNLAEICQQANGRSLVILDELGGATDPAEGQALASAVLEHLRSRGVYVVATTHFSKLKAYAREHEDIMISSMEFDREDIKPTYRYIENTIGQSYAIEIARRYGIGDDIIETARNFKSEQQTDSDRLLETLQGQIEEVRQQKERLDKKAERLKRENEQLKQDKQQLKIDQREIIDKAQKEAAEVVLQASERAEEIIDELKKQNSYSIKEVARLKHEMEELAPEMEEEVDGEITVGDYVRIGSSSQKGEVIEMDRKSAIVNCDGLKIQCKLSSLVRLARPAVKEKPKNASSSKVVKSSGFSIELNLLGYRVDEALEAMDKFLDNALVANVPFVRIVHGMGTGALRTAIWNRLRTYKFVKKFEHAGQGEGSTGVTVVTFRE
ncbi:MAG: endonuclease MutS2 [Erysipelotrichaceae bacterium]|nr:endonuclease MutS2 [Erysipelotrichaceae bacterium]